MKLKIEKMRHEAEQLKEKMQGPAAEGGEGEAEGDQEASNKETADIDARSIFVGNASYFFRYRSIISIFLQKNTGGLWSITRGNTTTFSELWNNKPSNDFV